MTKRRQPLSIGSVLEDMAVHFEGGWTEMGQIVCKASGYVRAWGDPDRREGLPFMSAVRLDGAFSQTGGEGLPLFELYRHELESAGALRPADTATLISHASDLIRECGEAGSAFVASVHPGASTSEINEALRQVNEAIEVLRCTQTLLQARLGIKPSARSTGPPPPGCAAAGGAEPPPRQRK